MLRIPQWMLNDIKWASAIMAVNRDRGARSEVGRAEDERVNSRKLGGTGACSPGKSVKFEMH